MLGSISRRGNRYLRAVFVQPARVVLVKLGPKHWERYGLKSWIEAAKKRLHHNVLAIALAPCARRVRGPQVGTKERPPGTNKGTAQSKMRSLSMT